MANKEAIQFQEALANKIKEWQKTEDFAAGSSNSQKLNRSLNLLLGSDPEVIIDMIGGDFVPKNPRDAMNLIRGLDLKTLKSMEILDLKGLGNKLVGHHSIAASTLQALRGMPPAERLKVYKGLSDMGQRFGMDPKQIFLIADKIHKSIAHEGDFTGVKTGVTLPYIAGETGDEFLRRFEGPMKQQLGALEKALAAGETQNYYKAINAIEGQLGLAKGTLINPDTPLELKKAATTMLQPTADQVRSVVNAGDNIDAETLKVLQQTPLKPKAVQNFMDVASSSGVIKLVKTPFLRRALSAVPVVGTVVGAANVEASAFEREKEIKENPNDPTLQANKVLDQISGWGDRTSLAGMATASTGVGAVPGAAMIAAGETASFLAGTASLAIDGGRAGLKFLTTPKKPKEEDLNFTTL